MIPGGELGLENSAKSIKVVPQSKFIYHFDNSIMAGYTLYIMRRVID